MTDNPDVGADSADQAPVERRQLRLCEVCLAYDDHPRIDISVDPDGPLGNHSGLETAQVMETLRPYFPANLADLAALRGQAQLDAVGQLDADAQDAVRALAFWESPRDFIAHMDCFEALPAELKPQGVGLSEHALEQVGVLKGDELVEHLTAEGPADTTQES